MDWMDRILAFFRTIEAPLADVLQADGCREGWLQGKFFRHFKSAENGFRVNCSYRKPRVKHDLYCARPSEMVAELKVYGLRGYYPKNLYGRSNIQRFTPDVPGTRVFLSLSDIETIRPSGNSFLSDVLRLYGLPGHVERMMILVLQKSSRMDGFGRAISAVQISRDEQEFECDGFLVRVSRM